MENAYIIDLAMKKRNDFYDDTYIGIKLRKTY